VVDAPPNYARFETVGGHGATISLHLVDAAINSGTVVYFDHSSAGELDEHIVELQKKGVRFIKEPTNES